MATQQGLGESLEPLSYKTWVLKVSIHCQGCKRKVYKILHGVEGVYTINIDIKQHKVIVTGNVEADTLIRKLNKSGKNAELWPEPPPEPKEKKSKKSKKKEKENEGDTTSEEEEDNEEEEDQNDQNGPDVEKHTVKVEVVADPTGKFPGNGVVMIAGGSGNQHPVADKKEGENVVVAEKTGSGKRKKKKKKGHKTVTVAEPSGGGGPGGAPPQDHYPNPPPMHPGPPPQYGYHQFPPHYHPPSPPPVHTPMPMPMYAVSYNTTHPSTRYATSYYAAPTPYAHPSNTSQSVEYCASPPRYSYGYTYGRELESPPSDPEYYPRKSSDSLELFSEENPNGCLIM